jgi:hypothetical protein
MVRLQIRLTPDQHQAVRKRARQLSVSIAEVIRRAVDVHVRPTADDRVQRALAAIGRYRHTSCDTDVARQHDVALADIYR